MQALHSSSALVYNVFQYWRIHDVSAIARMCGASDGMTQLRYEQTHRTPLGGIPPHLDVEFHGNKLKPLAVESKFSELYRAKKKGIEDKYINHPDLWKALPHCGQLANRIWRNESPVFSHLDAPQLLKHILGLATSYGAEGFTLLYLWYEVSSAEAQTHRKEIEQFKLHVGNEICFRDMTYQNLFKSIKESSEADMAYILFLSERYFS